jgi:hypothetical protein
VEIPVWALLIAVILVSVGGGIVAVLLPAGSGAAGNPHNLVGGTAATATATATSIPTATTNPNAGAPAYLALILADLRPLSRDETALGRDCGAGHLAACRADAVQFQTDILAFQNDLDTHPAPPCMATVDAHLRRALALYYQAATDVINGIDQSDP